MSIPNPREKLNKLLPEIDDQTVAIILDFTEYILAKKDLETFNKDTKTKGIMIEPFNMTVPWTEDVIIKREDAYSEERCL